MLSGPIDPRTLDLLTPEERERVEDICQRARKSRGIWAPLPGPQTEAYNSKADIVGYGGAAGGGKTDLAIGLALTQHQRVGLFRQNGTELTAIIDRIRELLGDNSDVGWNGKDKIWRAVRADGIPVQVELGSFPDPGDETKYQGRPHDLLLFDEASNMRERAVRFLLGWLRSTAKDQRCRALLTFNPPTSAEGRWIVSFFAPWLDDKHPRPAKPGELRWFAMIDHHEIEVQTEDPFMHGGELIVPQSRTFIPSRLKDNPYLSGTGYMAQLQALPEPLRSQMLHGDFRAGMEDDPWQVVPTSWVETAMKRWTKPAKLEPMDSIGLDVAMGGNDNTVIARRHDMWFDVPLAYTGRQSLDGPTIAGWVLAALRDHAVIHIDVFGVGAHPFAHLTGANQQAIGVNFGDPAGGADTTGLVGFKNLRSQLWWRMREALDPARNTGICLPPDRRLLADLCAPTWELRGRVIQVAGREEIIKRIGRSPDFGTAYVLALMNTPKLRYLQHLVRGEHRERREYDPYKNI